MRRLLPDVLDLRPRDPRMEATSCEAAIGSSPIPTATSRPSPAAVIAPMEVRNRSTSGIEGVPLRALWGFRQGAHCGLEAGSPKWGGTRRYPRPS